MKNIKHIIGFALFLLVIITTMYIYRTVNAPEENIPPVPLSISHARHAQENALSYEVESSIVVNLSSPGTYTRLRVKWNGVSSPPDKIWVWTYFFTEDSNGNSWSVKPVEINKPFAKSNVASIEVKASNDWYDDLHGQGNFYARVNVSTISADDALLPSEKINTDIHGATSVLIIAF